MQIKLSIALCVALAYTVPTHADTTDGLRWYPMPERGPALRGTDKKVIRLDKQPVKLSPEPALIRNGESVKTPATSPASPHAEAKPVVLHAQKNVDSPPLDDVLRARHIHDIFGSHP